MMTTRTITTALLPPSPLSVSPRVFTTSFASSLSSCTEVLSVVLVKGSFKFNDVSGKFVLNAGAEFSTGATVCSTGEEDVNVSEEGIVLSTGAVVSGCVLSTESNVDIASEVNGATSSVVTVEGENPLTGVASAGGIFPIDGCISGDGEGGGVTGAEDSEGVSETAGVPDKASTLELSIGVVLCVEVSDITPNGLD
jgi:hypothetical protein